MGLKHIILTFLFMAVLCQGVHADNRFGVSDSRAKELFQKVYDKVYGPQGSSLYYHVNIIGLYKTEGIIIYKGKQLHYKEKRYLAWEDGVSAYMVDSKKMEVRIFDYDDDRKDEYLSKFKFNVEDFDLSYYSEGDYYIITAKLRNSSVFGIRWVQAKVRRDTFIPESLTIKLAFIHTTVQISDFQSGNIQDSCFVFPADRFKDYRISDYRERHGS